MIRNEITWLIIALSFYLFKADPDFHSFNLGFNFCFNIRIKIINGTFKNLLCS